MRDPRIVAQSPDPRFAQRNPRMVRIRGLRVQVGGASLGPRRGARVGLGPRLYRVERHLGNC